MIPLRYNVRSLLVRKTTTIATALGIALVVFVLGAVADARARHRRRRWARLGSARQRRSSCARAPTPSCRATIEQRIVGLIAVGARASSRTPTGSPLGVGEVRGRDRCSSKPAPPALVSNVQRARRPRRRRSRSGPRCKIIEGRAAAARAPTRSSSASALRGRFKGLELGQTFELKKNRPVKVVGVFEAGGSSFESEVWADLDTRAHVVRPRGPRSRRSRVALESPTQVRRVQDRDRERQAARPRGACARPTYYEKQSEGTAHLHQRPRRRRSRSSSRSAR